MFNLEFSRYKILEELRKEGRSTIYKGFDSELQEKVLIRIIPINRDKDNVREGFEQGIIMAEKLSHPHIVKIFDLGRLFRQSYLMTEYAEAAYLILEDLDWKTLAHELKAQKPFPVEKAMDAGLQVSRVLEHVHQHGIIHKFINPYSIYWNGEKVKVTDFELHRSFFDYNLITPKGNTLYYLSPEQIRGDQPDARSDLFSLGVVLYEMLTGKKPFEGGDYKSITSSILTENPALPSSLNTNFPKSEDSMILKMLAKDPEMRYQTASELTAALESYQKEPPIQRKKSPTEEKKLPTGSKEIFIESILKENELFKSLDDKSLAKIASKLKLHTAGKDEVLIKEGELGRTFYIIKSGFVKIIIGEEGKNQATVTMLKQSACFGEMSLLTGEPSSATVKTVTPTELLTLTKIEFEKMLQENPTLNRYFHKLLSQRIRMTNLKAGEEMSKGFSGKLSAMGLAELIQTLNAAQKTGILTISRETSKGEIYIKQGNIVDTTVNELRGEKAFLELATWTDASFRFVPQAITMEPQIKMGTHKLLMEAMRRMDDLNLST